MLLSNLIKVVRALPAPGLLVCAGSPPRFVRFKVVDALPAIFFTENRTEFLQSRIQGAGAQGTAPFIFVIGITEMIIVPVNLTTVLHEVVLVCVVRSETSHVHLMGINGGFPLEDPFSQDFANATCASDTVDGSARANIEATKARDRSQGIVTIGRECVRPVDQLDNLRLGQHRYPLDGLFHYRFKQIPLRIEEFLRELPGNALNRPLLWICFKGTHQKGAHILSAIKQVVRISHHQGIPRQFMARDRLCGKVLMHKGNRRYIDPYHLPDPRCPLTGSIHHTSRPDCTLVCIHLGDLTG